MQLRAVLSCLFLLCLLSQCDRTDPAQRPQPASTQPAVQTSPPAIKAPAKEPTVLAGRWRSDSLCIELFANGDFEISLPSKTQGKRLIMGLANISHKSEGKYILALQVHKIWQARWTSRCRKVHQTGKWLDSAPVLGMILKPESTAPFKLSLTGSSATLCTLEKPEECQELQKDTPHLGLAWNAKQRKDWAREPPANSSAPKNGTIAGLQLGNPGSITIVSQPGELTSLRGEFSLRSTTADVFQLRFTPDDPLPDAPALPTLLGLKLEVQSPTLFKATRLANQQIEVCGAPAHCVHLQRYFDAYAWDFQLAPPP